MLYPYMSRGCLNLVLTGGSDTSARGNYVLVPRQEPRAATSSFLDQNVHELYVNEVFLDISLVA